MRAASHLLTLAALAAFPGCQEMLGSKSAFTASDAPEFREPSVHAAPIAVLPPAAPVDESDDAAPAVQTTLLEHARAARSLRPRPAPKPEGSTTESAAIAGEPPPIRAPAPLPEALFETRLGAEADELPPAAETPETEGAAWLESAAEITPGCLLANRLPSIPLPSPEAIAWLLGTQPRGFSGVPREALVCLLGVGTATRAEVFGATAFRPSALALRTGLAGDERLLGVVAAAVVTDEPRGAGVLIVAMDEREDGWTVRDTVYLPWDGSDATHRIASLTDERIVLKKRSGLVVRQRDRDRSVEHHLTLTTQDSFIEVARFPLTGTDDRGSVEASVAVTGKAFPKALSYRALQREVNDNSSTYVIERWTTEGEAPYRKDSDERGQLDLEGVAALLEQGRPADAAWVYEAIPKELREPAAALVLGARVEDARARPRKAAALWKRALSASDTTPEVRRDYARWLASDRKKKDAIKSFEKYLELAPDAVDRVEVEAEIEALRGNAPR